MCLVYARWPALNIGLVDVDKTRFLNLVLMKLSAWFKSKGGGADV